MVLAELRIARGISQEKLSFEAGVDRSYISLLERGHKSPTLDTVFNLCRALEIRFDQLARLLQAKLEDLNDPGHDAC
ncbi:helix-turn-helix domain-containing protein [Pseudomonas huaxiensis]|nr:helix-turn-helix transcriptional regulator [Pseudomonas huaxiensis]